MDLVRMQQFWKVLRLFQRPDEEIQYSTAAYETFDNAQEALNYLETADFPYCIKSRRTCFGRGVLICNTLEEAKEGVKSIMLDKQFGTAGNRMVIEEFMTGREVSVLSHVDGKTIEDHDLCPGSQACKGRRSGTQYRRYGYFLTESFLYSRGR